MIFPQRFKFYFVFCVIVLLSTFGLLLALLRCGSIRHLIAVFYSCEGNSNRQGRFDQSNISNYGHQYVEELEL